MLWDPSHREGFLSFQGRVEGKHVFSWIRMDPLRLRLRHLSRLRGGLELRAWGWFPSPRGGQEQEEVRNADYASKSRADSHADPVGAAVTFGTSR